MSSYLAIYVHSLWRKAEKRARVAASSCSALLKGYLCRCQKLTETLSLRPHTCVDLVTTATKRTSRKMIICLKQQVVPLIMLLNLDLR